ncbi:bifunctional diguanylate cyclase/phosphodiesterase [Oceanimonas sp. CHS3-5]|uniref:putative bifunctional diguanylate cyclase/phosphodiesterase n=1 Tax=Oceanimonas sp. CHS3-5 TaxID=3068186 RepID=UPI00273D7DFF|nr:bifunctional diguanylate cyclase/phosphodiesterase [Oceanimonas sp. CHS3-5]MDP5292367.1 bifunctional diguanylate cyclase/phosphodiesterase [Oceanimonas sp. CHS3-5]
MAGRPTTIRRYLLNRTLLFSVIGFLLLLVVANQAYQSSVRQSARQVAASVAQTTFNSMYSIMSQGWSRTQLETFLTQLEQGSREQGFHIGLYRGELVSERFGPIEQRAPDEVLLAAATSGRITALDQGEHLRYLYPLKAHSDCLACHTNARAGDTLGVISVEQDLSGQLGMASRNLLYYLLLLSPLPLLFAFWAVRRVSLNINQSVQHLSRSIAQVESLSDLSRMGSERQQFRFSEMNSIFGQVEQLADKLRNIAVDKDLLEFEIRLLEKFVITSEVVRDWREYVNVLMLDINQVLDIYTMFSIFKVDDELFDLEIFWLYPPAPATREMMEQAVLARLRTGDTPFSHGEFTLHHNVVNHDHDHVLELDEKDIELQTKSLLVEAPKIGGIVGIGVQADIVKDKTRVLVLESILSTLLNVVGSVKAIYKYTRDLEYYATRDPLTNLYNQRMLWELLDYELDRSRRHGYSVAMLLLDLDNFKSINDGYGHACGDHLLTELSVLLKGQLGTGDVLARYGGDEFVIVLTEAGMERARDVSERILAAVDGFAMDHDGGQIRVTCSVGVGIFPEHAGNAKDLFLFVDNLMYRAKSQGKNRVCLPGDEDVADIFRDLSEKTQLVVQAIEQRTLLPVFQPILPLEAGAPMAVEVLSRIRLADDSLMNAGEFIEIAESMGKVHLLDYIVMEKAFAQVRETGFDGLVFINLSPRAVLVGDFLTRVRTLVADYGIDAERVVFEITERDTIKSMTLLEQFVRALKDSGFLLAIDDFGSGFSSFHYLKHLPIDFVKIEGEFIANMTHDSRDLAFVSSITQLARQLGVKTVAEYVENQDVLDMVRATGIDHAQGFHVGRPHPQLSTWLQMESL